MSYLSLPFPPSVRRHPSLRGRRRPHWRLSPVPVVIYRGPRLGVVGRCRDCGRCYPDSQRNCWWETRLQIDLADYDYDGEHEPPAMPPVFVLRPPA